jgi:predicted amidohydrolase YtcJ
MRWMEQRIGAKRCEGAYAFRRLAENGALLCFGSDWPGTSASEYPINPLLALYAATTRQTVTGQPAAGWFPDQRVGIRDALKAHTYNGAYASFEEKLTGSIAAGKLADLVVLSRNLLDVPPRDILATDVLYTVVGGQVVYRKD